ncbi:hypothetical protein DESUT3_21000 [Desulfuromonas versatilis]|uniref:Uncharacterized protein n=1 Tax=Desulfuromonas versatilis TaxID=2802975 RepID=A0ABM8HWD9_9BACT|nr:hypothetical protein [Desulfuromonas versatilis]BCR05031.1 hypothetical protein DESUT3_21000 [Desulfuromonas versatilis]
MRNQEFEKLCCQLNEGGTLFVENLDSRYTGRVLACFENALEVEAFGHRFNWPPERCRPASGASPLGPPSSH